MPEVSVVMPVWNGEVYLREAVESVLTQSFQDFELLVVDDGSTDGTLQILNSYKDERLRVVQSPHGGIVSALNLGVAESKSDWIARLDADDIAEKDRLELQLQALRRRPGALVCYSDVTLFGDSSVPALSPRLPKTRALLALRFCYHCPIFHSSVMFNAKAFRKAGGYLPEERHAEDFGLWGRLIEMGNFVAVSRQLVRFRMHERSVSRQNLDEQNLLRDSIANRHCRQFMRLNETDAARAMRVLRAQRAERAAAEWRWFLFQCAPRLRWKSAEMIAWLAWRTLPFGAS